MKANLWLYNQCKSRQHYCLFSAFLPSLCTLSHHIYTVQTEILGVNKINE